MLLCCYSCHISCSKCFSINLPIVLTMFFGHYIPLHTITNVAWLRIACEKTDFSEPTLLCYRKSTLTIICHFLIWSVCWIGCNIMPCVLLDSSIKPAKQKKTIVFEQSRSDIYLMYFILFSVSCYKLQNTSVISDRETCASGLWE